VNPNYLEKLVDKWLEKSGDQYDQIKLAFKQTFDIYPIATKNPQYDDENQDDQILDIYSKQFPKKNTSFIDACKKVYDLCKEQQHTLSEILIKIAFLN